MRYFTYTQYNSEVFNNSDLAIWEKRGIWGNASPDFDTKFRAYDDDGIFYISGLVNFDYVEDLADHLAWDMGVTQLKLYDKSTNKYIDEIS